MHPVRFALIMVEFTAFVCATVALVSTVPFSTASAMFHGAMMVELMIVELPVIPSAVDEATVGE